MQVNKSELLDLFDALGVDTARSAGWDAAKLASRLNTEHGISRYRDPGQPIADSRLEELYDELVQAHMNHDPIDVIDDATSQAEPPVVANPPVEAGPEIRAPRNKPGPKPGAKRKEQKVQTKAKPSKSSVKSTPSKPVPSTWADKVKYWRRHPKTITDRGPGVLRAIVDELLAAGKGRKPKPVTKQFILDVLKDKFPERDEVKMRTTLNNMLPTGLRDEYGYQVESEKTESGYLGYYVKEEPAAAKKVKR